MRGGAEETVRAPRATRRVTPRQEQARTEILTAAADLIAQGGFHGMSMRDLAAATDRALASLYTYFDSKEGVLFALQAGAFEALLESARHAVSLAETGEGRLYAFIANHVSYVTEHRNVMRVLVHEASALDADQRRRLRALKDAYFEIARDLLAALRTPDSHGSERELELETYSVFGTINWVFAWYDPARHGSPFEVAATLHRMTMSGLGGRGEVNPAVAAELRVVERALRDAPNPSPIRPEVTAPP
jgi:AcrR family transcriptional regulator